MMTAESERLFLATEDRLGIKANEDDLEKFRHYLVHTYGGDYENSGMLEKAFYSGEAALFLTINETYFFREQDHFTLLRKLLPSFQDSINICSAATATGCEAYSIAMLIEHYNKGNKPLSYHIDAFDINPQVIEIAEKGIYGRHSFREDGSCFRFITDSYIKKNGDNYELDLSLKNNIHFFVHNILDPLEGRTYDLVFFRNAFIYFSPRSRIKILANLFSSLRENGKLIMGVSETAGVNHQCFTPLNVIEKIYDEVFYFQKTSTVGENDIPASVIYAKDPATEFPESSLPKIPAKAERNKTLHIEAAGVGDIISNEEEAAELTGDIWKTLRSMGQHGFSGNELAAAALFLLNRGDFRNADRVLNHIEGGDDSAFTAFLRGEYIYLQDMFTEAEFHYKVSLGKNDAFWPALYRLSSLASSEVLRPYRAQQALESLGRGMDLQYEVFIGGFSPDYYLGALLKRNVG
jgi:chemotaxis methyl-accepting protein methylase